MNEKHLSQRRMLENTASHVANNEKAISIMKSKIDKMTTDFDLLVDEAEAVEAYLFNEIQCLRGDGRRALAWLIGIFILFSVTILLYLAIWL